MDGDDASCRDVDAVPHIEVTTFLGLQVLMATAQFSGGIRWRVIFHVMQAALLECRSQMTEQTPQGREGREIAG